MEWVYLEKCLAEIRNSMTLFLVISIKRGGRCGLLCLLTLCLVQKQRSLKNEGIELFSCQAVPITAAGPLGEKPLVKYGKVGKGSRQNRSVTWGKRLALLDKEFVWGCVGRKGRRKRFGTRKGEGTRLERVWSPPPSVLSQQVSAPSMSHTLGRVWGGWKRLEGGNPHWSSTSLHSIPPLSSNSTPLSVIISV